MGAGRRVHHEDMKGAKTQVVGILRVVAIASALLMGAAVLASHARAQDRINPEELQRAAWYAALHWESAVHPASPWDARSRATWHDIDRAWGHGALALTAGDLLEANPGRKDDILVYLNDALIPAMYEHRSAYVCAYMRWYYGQTMLMHYGNGGEDPYLAVAYFIAPTRGYLREHNLSFPPRAQHYLQRYARFSPSGSSWQRVMATRDYIPCAPDGDATSSPGERL